MKKNSPQLHPEKTIADLANLAWCAQISLRLAQQDGQALTPLAIHIFLMRWLTVAQKQRRFPRSVAQDIEGLLLLGRKRGYSACLYDRLVYLWKSCSEAVNQQSDLFRLTYAIEYLKSQGWQNVVMADNEWVPYSFQAEFSGMLVLLVKKSELVQHFSVEGWLQRPIDFWVMGHIAIVSETLEKYALSYTIKEQSHGWCTITLRPKVAFEIQ
ncbi:hypothetical protein GTGU_04330 [Trabulsiella guamensis ATCC 49490]|uniref:DUF2913 family protein n=1 Tax=Trabulsiella guamensis ATCC 49490 TaxID=1005994 RepID=A0A084ZPD3_9ENTR|nr:DUF2913 family protein [Trabulsiella guamensis]KFB99327.1 hypothetical protein GTGU_04330 [Trabulsiella guamensis ATCC 49490]